MHRRDFLLRSALASAGLGLAAGPARALAADAAAPHAGIRAAYSSLAPRVALTDALHLAAADQTTPADFRMALNDFTQIAAAADAVGATPAEVVGLLGELRVLWPGRDDEPHERSGVHGDMAEQRLAWAAGHLAHGAIAQALGQPDAERARAHDAVLLRALHEAAPAAPAGPTPSAAELADLFRVVDQRTAIRLHTYTHDPEDTPDWVGRVVAWDRAQYDEAGRLAEAVLAARPDRAFLDPSDAAFRLARAARQARPIAPQMLDAIAEAPGASAYARAVGGAFAAVRAAGQFFGGALDTDGLLDRVARS